MDRFLKTILFLSAIIVIALVALVAIVMIKFRTIEKVENVKRTEAARRKRWEKVVDPGKEEKEKQDEVDAILYKEQQIVDDPIFKENEEVK
jgi:FtsZ-interacting cell division protein ZipA